MIEAARAVMRAEAGWTAHRPAPVLVAEDNGLVALDLCDALSDAGHRVLGPCASTAEALALIRVDCPAAAILDVMLLDGSSGALAAALREQGVPFVVYSGRSRAETLAREFQGAAWFDKPTPYAALVARVTQIVTATEVWS